MNNSDSKGTQPGSAIEARVRRRERDLTYLTDREAAIRAQLLANQLEVERLSKQTGDLFHELKNIEQRLPEAKLALAEAQAQLDKEHDQLDPHLR